MKDVSSPRLKTASLLAAAIGMVSTGVQAQVVLEEIVVTAQKREQNLQDVPIAVSAFTGQQLQEGVIKDVFDLATNVPGLRMSQNQNATQSNFSIRGVGTSAQNFGLESSVGLYVDGVYRSRQSSMINNMVDMEAVEVLRGPQGTLFGKNTPSGAILFRTQAPTYENEGFVELTAGNLGMLNVSGAANFSAIEDVLAFRITGFSSERDGYVSEDHSGDDVLNDRSRSGVRLQALYTPSDDVTVRFIADYAEVDEICCAALTTVDSITANARTNPDGSPIFGSDAALLQLGGTVYTAADFDEYRTALSTLPTSKNDDAGLSMEINWDRGDYSITSVTAYREFNSTDLIDSDFSDVNLIETLNDSNQESFSQELRVDFSTDNMNAVLGAYYFKQEIGLDYNLEAFSSLQPYGMAALGLGAFVDGLNGLSAATGGLFPAAAEAFPSPLNARHNSQQDHESWALFGQMDYSLSEDLVLTVGLRYTEEEKDMLTVFSEVDGNGNQFTYGPSTSLPQIGAAAVGLGQLGADLAVGDFSRLFDPAFMGQYAPYQQAGWGYYLFGAAFAPRAPVDVSLADEQITGSIKLSWTLTEDAMVYASYGTGYKSGGTNTDRVQEGVQTVFGAETSESFEVGFKGEFPDQALRLNLAAHYTTVDDFQASSFTGNGFNLQNAGSLETYGAEAEVFWRATETLTATLAYAYSFGEYDEFDQGTCWTAYPFHTGVADPGDSGQGFCDRGGDTIGNNPKHFSTLGLRKDFTFNDGITAYVMAEYSYQTETVLDANNDPFKVQDEFGLLNLRAGISFEDLDMDITAWGRNVLDEKYFRTTFDVPVQDGKLMTYPSEPATYGLTLNKRF